jgi:hypothetical protein
MPSARTTMLLAALVVLGGGYLFFFETRFETTQEHVRNQGRVLRLAPEEVQRIKIRRDAWTSALLERVDAHEFRVVEPVEGSTDAAVVMRLLSDLEFLKSRSVLAMDGADEKRRYTYGLSPARLEVDLGLNEGREVRLAFGNAPPVGGGVYLSVFGMNAIFVVDERVSSSASQLLDQIAGASQRELREKDQDQ